MSRRVKEWLDFIKPLGELYDPIEIEGEDIKNYEEQRKIHVNLTDYERIDKFSKENIIFGVNVVLKENDTLIEFVHDDRKWGAYKVQIGEEIYAGKSAQAQFLSMMNRAKPRRKPKPRTPYEPKGVTKEPEKVPKIEYRPEINLREVVGAKGIINPRLRRGLNELMDYGAVSPNDIWKWLPSVIGMPLYDNGLVERIRVEKHYEFRLRKPVFLKNY